METSVNNKCKAFTSLEQSKRLAEILPIESADMYYKYVLPKFDKIHYIPEIGNPVDSLKWYNKGYTFSGRRKPITLNDYCIPCWSLVALLDVLPNYQMQTQDDGIGILYSCNGKFNIVTADNPIDACVDMIEKLNELNLL